MHYDRNVNICRNCLRGPVHHPRCVNETDVFVKDADALNEAEFSQIEHMEPKLLAHEGPTYGPLK